MKQIDLVQSDGCDSQTELLGFFIDCICNMSFLELDEVFKKQHNVVKHVILNHGKSKARCAWNMDSM